MSKRKIQKELEQRTISLSGLVKPIQFSTCIHPQPLRTSLRSSKILKFDRFDKITEALQSLTKTRFVSSNFRVKIQLQRRATINTVDFSLTLKSRGDIFKELLDKSKAQILEEANINWLQEQNNKIKQPIV